VQQWSLRSFSYLRCHCMLYHIAIIIDWLWFIDGDQRSRYIAKQSKLLTRMYKRLQFFRDIFMQCRLFDHLRAMFGKPMHCAFACIFNWFMPNGINTQW
jgi:hypothetical protein